MPEVIEAAPGTRLHELIARSNIEVLSNPRDVAVASLAHDSRAVAPGALFFCVRGASADGHDFAPVAIARGAVAVVSDRPLALAVGTEPGVAIVEVPDVRRAIGPLSAAFYRAPSESLAVVGVTGTNGKTTTVHMIASVLTACGRPARSIGTLTGARTTPEAPELQAQLAAARDHRAHAVAIEVSSHALSQHRVDGTRFRAVAFTNLTPDHLDYHGTMHEYYKAKARLFTRAFSDTAVIDVDDPYGRRLADECGLAKIVRSGLGTVEVLSISATRSTARWRGHTMTIPIGGRFNVANAAIAADVVAALGVDEGDVAAAMAATPPVPGRFEPIAAGQPFSVIVDYAHTPDGLLRVLRAAREVAAGRRVLVVFGCGGDRDAAKRPLMGREARDGADVVVVTSDNPRGESPRSIVDQIVAGMAAPPDAVELDRRAAIGIALEAAAAGDVVVIAGKGHESVQIIGDRTIPFDDRAVARELLGERYRA